MGAAVVSSAASAQQRVPIVGFLALSSVERPSGPLPAIHVALRQAGYVLGQTVRIEYRYADWQIERLPALAAELAAIPANVIITSGGPRSAHAAKAATASVPIVFTPIPDPVRSGLVASLNRPGGNHGRRCPHH
jgi:putative ABC transport system substrate-binding protein